MPHSVTEIIAFFQDHTFLVVAIGCAIFGIVSGVIGSFAVLRHQSLMGDGISHAALPGIIIAFLITGNRSTEVLQLGALISGLSAALLMFFVVKYSCVNFDSALALLMSVFFGLGLVLLTYSQKQPNTNRTGLSRFIYGQAAAVLRRDVVIIAVCGAIILLAITLFWKELKLFTFDAEFAQSAGLNARWLGALLSLMIVLTIIIGLQMVGVVLVSAMLISPAVAARQWTERLVAMVVLAAAFGAASGVIGAFVSSVAPGIPTGPTIVVSVSLIAAFSLLFSPSRGVISKTTQHMRNNTEEES